MVSTHIPRSFHISSCPISDAWGSVSHPVGSFSIQGQKLALQGHFSICCTPMAQEGMNIQPWDALSSSTKGHRRTQDYRLRFLSWLLEPGPVIPVLSPVCPWDTVNIYVGNHLCSTTKYSMGWIPTALLGGDVAAGQDRVLLIITPISPGAAKRHQCWYSAVGTALLGPGTWVVHSTASAIVSFVSTTRGSQDESLLKVNLWKQHRLNPGSIKCQEPPALHCILLKVQPSIRFVFSLQASLGER